MTPEDYKELYERLQKRLRHVKDSNRRLRKGLRRIANREHIGCVCGAYTGPDNIPKEWENGHHWTCPTRMARNTLEQDEKNVLLAKKLYLVRKHE